MSVLKPWFLSQQFLWSFVRRVSIRTLKYSCSYCGQEYYFPKRRNFCEFDHALESVKKYVLENKSRPLKSIICNGYVFNEHLIYEGYLGLKMDDKRKNQYLMVDMLSFQYQVQKNKLENKNKIENGKSELNPIYKKNNKLQYVCEKCQKTYWLEKDAQNCTHK